MTCHGLLLQFGRYHKLTTHQTLMTMQHSITDLGAKHFLVRSGLSTSPNWSIKLTARQCRLGVHARTWADKPWVTFTSWEVSVYRLKSSWYDYTQQTLKSTRTSTVPLTHSLPRIPKRCAWGPPDHARWYIHAQSHWPTNLKITRKHFNFPNTWGFYTIIPTTLYYISSDLAVRLGSFLD